jgi:trehalose 6-phosphate phosphatase
MPGSPLLDRFAAEPESAALILDVDGTLAPIADRPEDACVPPETRAELARLRDRYALVGCLSGRPAGDAARVVGVEGLVYAGEHGLELEPEAEAWAGRLAAFAAGVDWPAEKGKRLTLSFHYRVAVDEEAARAYLDRVAERARAEGFLPRFGRKVLEVRPPLAADKGTAVLRLLGERGLRRALYAGDDATDLDAFHALDRLELAVRVAVASDEAPRQLAETADVVVGGPAELLELLRGL